VAINDGVRVAMNDVGCEAAMNNGAYEALMIGGGSFPRRGVLAAPRTPPRSASRTFCGKGSARGGGGEGASGAIPRPPPGGPLCKEGYRGGAANALRREVYCGSVVRESL